MLALGLLALGPAATHAADDPTEAALERALPATTDTEIDGLNWHCTGDKCVGTPVGGRRSGARLEDCRKLASAIGKVASFASRGKEMSKRDLDSCNRGAR
jgi:hypothetical protein